MPPNNPPINSDQSQAVRTAIGNLADAAQHTDETLTITRTHSGPPTNPTIHNEYPLVTIQTQQNAAHTNSDHDNITVSTVKLKPALEPNTDEEHYTGHKIIARLYTYDYTDFPPFTTWKNAINWADLGFTTEPVHHGTEPVPETPTSVFLAWTNTTAFENSAVKLTELMRELRQHRTKTNKTQ